MNPGKLLTCPKYQDGYSDFSDEAIPSSCWIFLECGVENGPFYLNPAEVILMDGLIIGIEVDLGLIHFFIVQYFLQSSHHIADHLALPCLPTDIHKKDEHFFRWNLSIHSS